MHRVNSAFALTLAVSLGTQTLADTTTIVSGRDNTLYDDGAGLLSNGAGEFFYSGETGTGVTRRGLMWFDVFSAIPVGSTINSVALTLHMSMTSGGASNVGLHSVLANWGEGASNAPGGEGAGTAAMAGDATWLHTFFNSSLWANAGGDFNASASAITLVNAIGFYSWTSATMTTEVQNWLDAPAGNFGWLLIGDESVFNTSKRWDTRESLTADFRPMLSIDYMPIPAPGALTLLAFAVVAGRRRRRANV